MRQMASKLAKNLVKMKKFSGVLIFFVVNTIFILVQTWPASIPRLGDDALTYLYKGHELSSLYAKTPLATASIIELNDSPDYEQRTDLRWLKSRVAMRHVGTLTPLFDAFTLTFLNIAPSLKWAFFCFELLVLSILTLAIYRLGQLIRPGHHFFLPCAVLALSLLPAQGLHYFIPGVFAMSAGLLLAVYLTQTKTFRFAPSFILLNLATGTHPIGKLYVGVAFFSVLFRKEPINKLNWCLTALLALVIMSFYTFLPAFFPNMKMPVVGDLGGISFQMEAIQNNWAAFISMASESFQKNLAMSILSIMGIYAIVSNRLPASIRSLALALAAILCAGCLHYLPGYPAELMIRIWVPLIIIFCLASSVFFASLRKEIKIVLMLVIALGLVQEIKNKHKFSYRNLNSRNHTIYDDLIKKDAASIPKGSQIFFCETDVALTAFLLTMGEDYRVVPYPMLKNDPALSEIVTSFNSYMVIPTPPKLNYLNHIGSHSFLQRRQNGFFLPEVKEMEIYVSYGKMPQILFLKLQDVAPDDLVIESSGGEKPIVESVVNSDWIRIEFFGALDRIVIKPEKTLKQGSLSGIRIDPISLDTEDRVLWPWGSALHTGVTAWDKDKKAEYDFDFSSIATAAGCGEINASMNWSNVHVFSDRSGIIMLKKIGSE